MTHTDFNGNAINFEYDENNRLIKKSFPDGSEEFYTYTATGRKDTVIDSRGTTLNYYDSGDRLIKVVNPDESMIKYEYDTMGNRTVIIIDQDTTRYTFDQLNRLKTVIDPDSGITTYTYDAVGNRSSITYPNMTVAEYTYDSQNRLIKLFNHKSNGDTISYYTYTLGPAGNRIKVTEHNGRTVDYSYDSTYKLVQERIDDPDFGFRIISYTYDPVGNRLTKIDNSDTTTYEYDHNDRLLTENSQLATRNYTYDNNGNTITKTSPTENIAYAYDQHNRLIRVDDGVSVVEYAYDTDGIRVQKTIDGVNTINYIVDKNRDYAQVLQMRDGNGTVIVSYNYGDDLISQKRKSSLSYYHYDGQMSTRQLTDDSANITDGYNYDAFGILINKFGATVNDYLYTGEQYDPNVGFYYLRARYYNQNVGRFISIDPFQGLIYDLFSLHRYLYANANPSKYFDPSGYFSLSELATTTWGMAIIGAAFGMTGYSLGTIIVADAEWQLEEFLLSGVMGAAGNVAGGIFGGVVGLNTAAHIAVVHNMIFSAALSSATYAITTAWRNEDLTAYGAFLSIIAGGFAGLMGGPGAAPFIRGTAASLSGKSLESFIKGFTQYIDENSPEKYVSLIKIWLFKLFKSDDEFSYIIN